MLASRFIFPKSEDHVEQFIDGRTPVEKFRDIISVINGKLDPELASLWSDLCKYDIAHECYYKSGISYLERDMKLLQKQFKFNKELKLNSSINMPECIKSSEHSNYCNPSNNNCSYISESNKDYTDPKQLIEFLFHNQNKIYLTLQNKNNAKLVISYLMQIHKSLINFLNNA